MNDIAFKSRGLANFCNYTGLSVDELTVSSAKEIRVLELGCGYGQLLFDLSTVLPKNTQFCGINSFKDKVDFKKMINVASLNGKTNVLKRDIDAFTFLNCDLEEGLPTNLGKFDLILSQVTLPYIKNKLPLIQNVITSLKETGIAHMHVAFENSLLCDKTTCCKWSTLQIKSNSKTIPLKKFWNKFYCIKYENRKYGSTITLNSKSNFTSTPYRLTEVINLGIQLKGMYGYSSLYEF